MTTKTILERNGRRTFTSQRAYLNYVKRSIRLAGWVPIKATYNEAGNCTICDESGRCPGWHTTHDIKP